MAFQDPATKEGGVHVWVSSASCPFSSLFSSSSSSSPASHRNLAYDARTKLQFVSPFI